MPNKSTDINLKRSIVTTSDGSKTIEIEAWNEQYHSLHGALQEARYVYIEAGFKTYLKRYPDQTSISILEMGFGTGLNTLLTVLESMIKPIEINYHGIDAYPLKVKELEALQYPNLMGCETSFFNAIHKENWGEEYKILPHFKLLKRREVFSKIKDLSFFDIIYFDAFGPRVQPELWEVSIFENMFQALNPNGILVTYCAKGSVRRHMQSVGFKVERLPGPTGKREMLRASKI